MYIVSVFKIFSVLVLVSVKLKSIILGLVSVLVIKISLERSTMQSKSAAAVVVDDDDTAMIITAMMNVIVMLGS